MFLSCNHSVRSYIGRAVLLPVDKQDSMSPLFIMTRNDEQVKKGQGFCTFNSCMEKGMSADVTH